jgi:hypothetical protein
VTRIAALAYLVATALALVAGVLATRLLAPTLEALVAVLP